MSSKTEFPYYVSPLKTQSFSVRSKTRTGTGINREGTSVRVRPWCYSTPSRPSRVRPYTPTADVCVSVVPRPSKGPSVVETTREVQRYSRYYEYNYSSLIPVGPPGFISSNFFRRAPSVDEGGRSRSGRIKFWRDSTPRTVGSTTHRLPDSG